MPTRHAFALLTAVATLAILVIAHDAGRWALAVYALSFWHYLVYVLAFLWRRIAHERFMRDGVLLKSLSLAAFGAVLWVTAPSPLALAVMAAGFTLNISAARALGAARTYYGLELLALPARHVTSFPYSLTAHPMLFGNVLGCGGALIDHSFRQNWWPLGVLHVALNLLIIVNEAYGKESRSAGAIAAVAGLATGAVLLLAGFRDVWPHALSIVLIGALFGLVIMRRYA